MKKVLVAFLSIFALSQFGYAQNSGLPGPIIYSVASGSVNALSVNQTAATLTVGQQVVFLPNLANTIAAPTLSVNGLAAKPITKLGAVALTAGDLTTTAIATVIYDGTEWQLLNPQTLSGSGAIGISTGGTGQTTAAGAFNALTPMTTLGDLEYASGSPAAARLAGSTSSSPAILTQTGNGTTSAAPVWSIAPTFSGANITALNGGNISTGIVPLASGGWGANFAPHTFLGNPGSTTVAPTVTLLGAQDVSVPSYVAAAGAVNVLTATYSPAVTSLAVGLTVNFIPNNNNTTTTPTLNVNGLGAKTITKFGQAALAANDLITTGVASAIYDGTYWELQNPATLTSAGNGVPPIVGSYESVASSTTPTFSNSLRYSTTILTASVTSFTLAAAGTAGQEKTLTFCENATGGFTVAPPANVRGFAIFLAGSTGSANKCGSQHFSYDTSQTAWLSDGPAVINE